jgi:hypothetical protein
MKMLQVILGSPSGRGESEAVKEIREDTSGLVRTLRLFQALFLLAGLGSVAGNFMAAEPSLASRVVFVALPLTAIIMVEAAQFRHRSRFAEETSRIDWPQIGAWAITLVIAGKSVSHIYAWGDAVGLGTYGAAVLVFMIDGIAALALIRMKTIRTQMGFNDRLIVWVKAIESAERKAKSEATRAKRRAARKPKAAKGKTEPSVDKPEPLKLVEAETS